MKRVLIIDDHKLIYDGINNRIKEDFLFDYASSPQDALDLSSKIKYSIAIIDITLASYNGFDLARLLKHKISTIVFLSMHKSAFYAQEAIRSGYQGYFLKEESLDLLIECLKKPQERDFWCSSEVEYILEGEETKVDSPYDNLTSREQQIFRLLSEGYGYKEIAFQLDISSKTVSVHREKILKKMNVSGMAELVKEAIKLGIVSLD